MDYVYLKAEQSVCVSKRQIYVKDIIQIYTKNKKLEESLKNLKVFYFSNKMDEKEVISILKVIEIIENYLENEYVNIEETREGKPKNQIEIVNLGEEDFIVYFKYKRNTGILSKIKICMVCLVAFIGSMYSIISYNTDVSAKDTFEMVYKKIMGKEENDFSILEISYSIGLLGGMVIFFNHGGNKKITKDPTPLEVQMRIYEKNVNDSFIISEGRKDKELDVN